VVIALETAGKRRGGQGIPSMEGAAPYPLRSGGQRLRWMADPGFVL